MKTIAIYPGRFQPFGPHHFKTFEWLASKFGKDNTFIVTSNKIESGKSPMTFDEKLEVMMQYGIPKSQVIQVKNPYVPNELLKNFSEDTSVVFTYGKKDAGRLRYTKKDGTPAYFQKYTDGDMEGYKKHGYVIVAPHISFSIPNYGEMSGTVLRKFVSSATPQEFERVFGWFDEDIYTMMRNKFGGKLNEISNGYDYVDDGPRFFYGDLKSYQNSTKKPQKVPVDFEIVDWILGDSSEPPNHGTDWPNGPVPSVTFFPAGVADDDAAGTRYIKDMVGNPAYQTWLSYIKKVIGVNDTMIDDIDADAAKRQKKPIQESILERREEKLDRFGKHDRGGLDVDEILKEFISYSKLKELEKYADELFSAYDIDVEFTRHFHDRLNDPRNGKDITVDEMKRLFNSVFKKHGKTIDGLDSGAERIIKSMSTDINMPFVFQWDNRNQEFDIVAKTVMRKRNFLSRTPFLKVESRKLITEGGAFGHLIHPYEDPNMTFDDIVELANKSLQGELSVEGGVQEKLDGQNLNVTYKNGQLGAARNKTTIKNPMSSREIANKFEGRGDIKTAFVEAMNDLESAFQSIGDEKLQQFFGNGKSFLNIEVIFPSTSNVIDYGSSAYLVLLGMVEYDENGNIVQNRPELARQLQGIINSVNAQQQNTFTLIAPKLLNIARSDDFDGKISYYKTQIQKIASDAGLSLGAKLGDYYDIKIEEFIDKNFNLTNELKDALITRWSRGNKSFRFTKNVLGDQYEKFKQIDGKGIAKVFKQIRWPIEKLILQLGADVMSNINDFLTANPSETVQSIRNNLSQLVKQARAAKRQGNEEIYNKFVDELKRIQAIGGFEKIIPSEGIVFQYKGRLMKFTGTYAPINQLLGLFRYAR